MHGLGVYVIIFERGDKVLRGFDDDIRDFLVAEMIKKGIKFMPNTNVDRIEQIETGFTVHTTAGETVTTDLVMYATGRVPNAKNLGLENLGVALDTVGAIIVNKDYQTNVPSIYALGDVTNRVNLTPVATAEGMFLVNKLYANKAGNVDYENVPTLCLASLASVLLA